MAGPKRPPLTEGEKVLFGRIEHLILDEGCSYSEAADRLGLPRGAVKGLIHRWEFQTGGNFTERKIASNADRLAAWVRGGKKGPAPKLSHRPGLTDIGLLVACLERGVLVFEFNAKPYPPETATAARKYAETCLRPEERERMIRLINYRSTMHVYAASEDMKEALRTEQKEKEKHKGPRGIRRRKRREPIRMW